MSDRFHPTGSLGRPDIPHPRREVVRQKGAKARFRQTVPTQRDALNWLEDGVPPGTHPDDAREIRGKTREAEVPTGTVGARVYGDPGIVALYSALPPE